MSQPNWVIVYSEIRSYIASHDTGQENLEIHTEVYSGDAGLDRDSILRLFTFPWQSGKSLTDFLKKCHDLDTKELDIDDTLSPAEILLRAMQERLVSVGMVRNYLLEPTGEYIYSLQIRPVQDGRTFAKNLQPPVTKESTNVLQRPAELDESFYNDPEDD